MKVELPSFKLLTLHALRFRLITSCSALNKENSVTDFIELLLTDVNDASDFERIKETNYKECGTIKLLLMSGKKAEAV